jgi:hypothetical protein
MFAHWCIYRKAGVVYWASASWEAAQGVAPFLQKEVSYTVGQKQRKLIFLKTKRRQERRCNVMRNTSKHKGSE